MIPPHTVTTALASTLDVFATFLELGRAQTPAVVLDSHSLVPILRDPAKERGQREAMFLYGGCQLHAVRLGEWKAHYVTAAPMGKPQNRCCQACLAWLRVCQQCGNNLADRARAGASWYAVAAADGGARPSTSDSHP